MHAPQHKSELNRLLVKLDNLLATKNNTVGQSLDTVGTLLSLTALVKNEDIEINLDLFDGVSDETRRAVLFGFVHAVMSVISDPDRSTKMSDELGAAVKATGAKLDTRFHGEN